MVTLRRRYGWMHTATATLILIFAASGSEPPTDVPASPGSIRINAMSFNAMSFNSLLLRANEQLADHSLAEVVAQGSPFESDLITDPYAREFMEYLVSCALDENDSLRWSGGGLSATWAGSLGLCPDWGRTAPSEECQELVSACLLARTNAYGQSVEISLRGLHTDNTPLPLGATEAADFPWQEGGFFGNVFCEDCVDPSIEMFVWQGLLYYRYRLSDSTDGRFVDVACDSFVGLPEPEARRLRDQCHWRFLQATNYEGVVYRAMFACWSPKWDDGMAYTLERICAGATSHGGYMADQKQCAAWPVGACTNPSPGVPWCPTHSICDEDDSSPQPNDGDVDDCAAMPMPSNDLPQPGECPADPPMTAPVWHYPLTVFLEDPCDVVRDPEACRVNREMIDPFTGRPR